MGVEVGGDFRDLLEDLESFIFEVDGAEADGLELAQDFGIIEPRVTAKRVLRRVFPAVCKT